jgi:hypothetical protein
MVSAMDSAEKSLAKIKPGDDSLTDLRDQIDAVIAKATKTADVTRRNRTPTQQARSGARKRRASGIRNGRRRTRAPRAAIGRT